MRLRTTGRLIAVPAIVIAVMACSAVTPAVPSPTQEGSVERFIAQLNRNLDRDYTPISGADDAARRADLIVLGKITNVSEGIEISGPEGLWNVMLNLDVRVERVLSGPGDQAGQLIHVQVFASPSLKLNELAASLPPSRVVFVLDDITRWIPFPDAMVAYPSGLVEGNTLYTPYVDGVVFDDSSETRHLYLNEADAAAAWTGAVSFDDLVAKVEAAGRSR